MTLCGRYRTLDNRRGSTGYAVRQWLFAAKVKFRPAFPQSIFGLVSPGRAGKVMAKCVSGVWDYFKGESVVFQMHVVWVSFQICFIFVLSLFCNL